MALRAIKSAATGFECNKLLVWFLRNTTIALLQMSLGLLYLVFGLIIIMYSLILDVLNNLII